MADNKKKKEDEPVDPFSGFEDITKNIIPGIRTEEIINDDPAIQEELDTLFDDEEEIAPVKKQKKSKEKEVVVDEEEDEEEEPVKKTKKNSKSIEDEIEEELEEGSKKTSGVDDVDESEFITPFVDLFAEELGWELEEDEKPKTAKELTAFMQDIIETNSKPKYSSEISERFDKYVANGGDPTKFMEVNFGEIDYTKVDVAKADNQKRVLRDYYKKKGFSEQKIDKYIERLTDSDELEEEAKDALIELKDIQEENRIRLEKEQEKKRKNEIAEHQRFVSSTEDYVAKLDNISGIKLTKKDKEEILPYIFQVGRDGKTQQQKDYEANPIEYLVATSFIFKNRKDLEKRIDNKSLTSAAEKFKQKQQELKNKNRKHKSDFANEDVIEEGEDWLAQLTGKIVNKKG